WISGAHFHRLDPLVLGGVGRNREVLIGDGAVGRDGIVFLHAEDRVRLADVPLGGVDRRRRQILGVAFRRAGRHPLHDGVAIGIGETAIADELAVRWIGEPRRQRPPRNGRRNRLRPPPRILVGEQRHWRELAGSMAVRAVLEKDRRDVFGERRGRRFRRRRLCAGADGREAQRRAERRRDYGRSSDHAWKLL